MLVPEREGERERERAGEQARERRLSKIRSGRKRATEYQLVFHEVHGSKRWIVNTRALTTETGKGCDTEREFETEMRSVMKKPNRTQDLDHQPEAMLRSSRGRRMRKTHHAALLIQTPLRQSLLQIHDDDDDTTRTQ